MKKISIALTAVALAVSAGTVSANCDSGERVVKFSHVTGGTTHPKVVAANSLAERVNKEMDGKLCVEVYPNSTLFGDSKELEALLLGDVQLLAPSLSKFGSYTSKYGVFDLPFVFNDMDHAIRFTNSSDGKELLREMEGYAGFVGLGYWMSGMKYFSAKKPLTVPSDASGMKFRVQTSDVAKQMIRAMDASPQAMAFSEVYGALQTGVVDGQENTWSNIYTKKFYEVQDSVTETNHQLLAYLFMTSSDFLNSLSKADREQFVAIADEVTQKANQSVKAKEAANRANILKAGGKINVLTPEQRKEWVDTMKPVWKQFESDIGKDLIESANNA
ncbi:TRAP transporter substrate-binding protein [Marinomonas mediterranea]|uniref:TRAP dicarboxylate transporter, DctP subunit n=1 Tax=Marinomonas mediterranea (strain ATCC 700492 / JCM 21426 / NBRC 103028 / MMB-1) TaxID=717774 RepID=F2K3U2_MARM1|nr:TRAP transporter substrate-binding protein [Marinomonas mediterranea]ADZ90191.1 TRAP dicarboxylate transporter, DctP subunit [Marinomonas mediterranea MMB-1]WCN08252.1 DctP family TRAP transporter solute-binding subunit [Marinomonas mediterranea]WCN12318.1 DctP family TRAP transporter solute-binding subunit [Marinomonas mediterranea]WCN16390.1 DctP family TRAP transporter solute-binding subunit [Marinomonas mediterranea MMB-1]